MRTSDFDFVLPEGRIAQSPVTPRDAAKLMIVDRHSKTISHGTFRDLAEIIPENDLLVLNTTKVFRARLLGTRDGSGRPAEVFLLKSIGGNRYEALVRPGGKLAPGRRITIAPELSVEIESVTDRRTRMVRLDTTLPIDDALERFGHVPLPPYIERADGPNDANEYQTVYAKETGSVAAPTAGLHFTQDMLTRLTERGVKRADVLLHVGAGTFKPVEVDDPDEHPMHEEWYAVTPEAAAAIAATRARGNKVWAVGTTSARTLESAAQSDGTVRVGENETKLFIRPPYTWRAVDNLITNFHLPRSTLLMLVAARAGYDLTMHAYEEAIAHHYRFFSYGDAMAII